MAKREELEPVAKRVKTDPAVKQEAKEEVKPTLKQEVKKEAVKEEVKEEVIEGSHEGHGGSSSSWTQAAAAQPHSSSRGADASWEHGARRGPERPWRYCRKCNHKAYVNKHYWNVSHGWCFFCEGLIW